MTSRLDILIRSLLSAAVVLLACQCGPPSPPTCRFTPSKSRVDSSILITQAREAWNELGRTGSDEARINYNTAVAKLVDQFRCGRDDYFARADKMGTAIDV